MTLCPIALLVHCKNCPILTFCLVKGLIGDYQPPAPPHHKPHPGKEPTDKKPAK